MAEITLDGLDIRNRASIFLDLMSGLYEPADVRGTDTVVPGLDGRIARNRLVDIRRVTLTGYVTGSNTADWRSNTVDLMTACSPLAIVALVLSDSYLGVAAPATLNVRFLNAIGGPPTYGVLYQSWSLEFESIDPEWA